MKKLTKTFEEIVTSAAKLGENARISAFVSELENAVREYNKEVVGHNSVQIKKESAQGFNYAKTTIRLRQEELL